MSTQKPTLVEPALPHLVRVRASIRARTIGYYATRQSLLKQGGNMADVAWVLISQLLIQGVDHVPPVHQ